MDRTCMAGVGNITLRGERDGQEFLCTGTIDSPPTPKGRIPGIFTCSGNQALGFALRNLGPDQGLGIARASEDAALMIFFYHVSHEEAVRRFPSVQNDINTALAGKS